MRKDFGKWMVKHIDQWFAWIRRKGLEINRMEDIILVTGTDHARSSANVAFLGGQAVARVSFGVDVARSKIKWQFSSERKAGGAVWNWGPSGEVSRHAMFFRHQMLRYFWRDFVHARTSPRISVYLFEGSASLVGAWYGGQS